MGQNERQVCFDIRLRSADCNQSTGRDRHKALHLLMVRGRFNRAVHLFRAVISVEYQFDRATPFHGSMNDGTALTASINPRPDNGMLGHGLQIADELLD